MLEEYNADHVLQQSCLGIELELILAHESTDTRDLAGLVAGSRHDFAEALRVHLLEVLAPFQIAGAAVRIALARRAPALNVLAAGGDPQRLGRRGCHSRQRYAHAPAIDQLRRLGLPLDLDRGRVG